MAYRRFNHARIAGVSAAVPEPVRRNADIAGDPLEIGRTARLCGIEARHVAPAGVCASDLCHTAAEQLLDALGWDKNSVDGLIFLSQTPDYVVPATSCVLQRRLGLSFACAAFDITLGCSGYVYGLMVGFGLLARDGMRRILLLVGDTPSKLISPHDIPANVLFGDAGTATAIEYSEEAGESYFVAGTNGAGSDSLIIEAGGFRQPRTADSAERKPHAQDKVLRSQEELYMDGSAVFGLTLKHVPELVQQLSSLSGCPVPNVDRWLFHQANRFMLDYFAKRIGIEREKMPINIDRFGNTSPPSIPLMMVTEHDPDAARPGHETLGMIGFGVGFSWGGGLLQQANPLTLPLMYHRQ